MPISDDQLEQLKRLRESQENSPADQMKLDKIEKQMMMQRSGAPMEESPAPEASPEPKGRFNMLNDQMDKYSGNPMRAAALAAMNKENPLSAAWKNQPTSNQQVSRRFNEVLEEAGAPLRAPGQEEFPLQKPGEFVSDLALNAPLGEGMGAMKGSVRAYSSGAKALPALQKALKGVQSETKVAKGMSEANKVLGEAMKGGEAAMTMDDVRRATNKLGRQVDFAQRNKDQLQNARLKAIERFRSGQ